jgi:hypothetical protein
LDACKLVSIVFPITFNLPVMVVFESTVEPPTLSVPDSVSLFPVIFVNVDVPPTLSVPTIVVPPTTTRGPPLTFREPTIVVWESTVEPLTRSVPVTVSLYVFKIVVVSSFFSLYHLR